MKFVSGAYNVDDDSRNVSGGDSITQTIDRAINAKRLKRLPRAPSPPLVPKQHQYYDAPLTEGHKAAYNRMVGSD